METGSQDQGPRSEGCSAQTQDNRTTDDQLEAKRLLLSDRDFRNSLLLDMSKYVFNSFGLVGFLFTAAIIFVGVMGYNSLGEIARSSMDKYLKDYAQPYEKEFRRLSQIPSYSTVSASIVLNDTTLNFVPFPFFRDIGRSALPEECQWFITLEEIDGSRIRIKSVLDTLDGSEGLRFTSTNERIEPNVGILHGPAGHWVPIEGKSRARVFIFACRQT